MYNQIGDTMEKEEKWMIKSPSYQKTKIETQTFDLIRKFMRKNFMDQKDLAEYIGISQSRISRLLNENFNPTLTKFVELTMGIGYIPVVTFVPIDEAIGEKDGE